MKKVIQYFGILLVTLLSLVSITRSSYALVDDMACTVTNSDDNISDPSFGSLRRKVLQGFNRPSNRFCADVINFQAGRSYNIVLTDTLAFTYSDSTLTVDGAGTLGTVIDAVNITSQGKCAIQLDNGDSTWKNITLKVDAAHAGLAFCGSAQGTHHNDGENGFHVMPVADPNNQPPQSECNNSDACCNNNHWRAEGDACSASGVIDGHCDANHVCVGSEPDCVANSTCCDSSGNFISGATACTDSHGTAGACDGQGTCVPTPVDPNPDCISGSPCCDSNGHFESSGDTCTDPNGEAGSCNGHGVCISEATPECVPDIECCSHTGHYLSEGTSCDDGQANTNNDRCVSHHCVGTPMTTDGNSEGDGSQNSDTSNNNNQNNDGSNEGANEDSSSNACSGKLLTFGMKGSQKTVCSNGGGCSLNVNGVLDKGHYFTALLAAGFFMMMGVKRFIKKRVAPFGN